MKNRVVIFLMIFTVALSGLTGCGLASESTIAANGGPYQVVRTVYPEAPLAVSEIVNGRDFSVNLVKLTGSATSSGRTVTVNGAPAIVTAPGETLLVLNAGQNVVQLTNRDGTAAENMTVSFTPPLAVYVTGYKMDRNYSLPVDVRGYVNRPDAVVTVNGFPAFVSVDGSFAAEVQLTVRSSDIQAVATHGDEATEYTIMQSLSQGVLTPVYGSDYRFEPHLLTPKNPVILKPGSTATADLTLMLRTDNGVGPEKCSISVPGSYPGLSVSITPSEFEGYPNINYHQTITVTANPNAATGQYPFRVEFTTASGSVAAANLNVVVER